MTEKTPNHQLNKYQPGDSSWSHTPDMETIEKRLVIRAKQNDRYDYTPHSGAIFIATDTGAVFDGDGSSWNAATRGFDEIGIGGEFRSSWPDSDSGSNDGTFDQIRAENINGIIYASENVAELPSIQEAVDELGNHEDWRDIVIVGGKNELTEIVNVHGKGTWGERGPHTIGIRTAAHTYLTQPDGQNLNCLLDVRQSRCAIDVSVDGNSDNQTSDVIGVRDIQNGMIGYSFVRAYDCDIGYEITGASENRYVDVNGEECGTLVKVVSQDEYNEASQHPAQILFRVRGDDNGFDIENLSGTIAVQIFSENAGTAVYNEGTIGGVWGTVRNADLCIHNNGGHVNILGGFYRPSDHGTGFYNNWQTMRVANCRLWGGKTAFRLDSHSAVSNCTVQSFDTGVSADGSYTPRNLYSVSFNNVTTEISTSDGAQVIRDGFSVNSGDPNSTGVWNGNGRIAFSFGASVYDTDSDNWYFPTPDGNWHQIT